MSAGSPQQAVLFPQRNEITIIPRFDGKYVTLKVSLKPKDKTVSKKICYVNLNYLNEHEFYWKTV